MRHKVLRSMTFYYRARAPHRKFGGGGVTSLLLPPGAENPSYATVIVHHALVESTQTIVATLPV